MFQRQSKGSPLLRKKKKLKRKTLELCPFRSNSKGKGEMRCLLLHCRVQEWCYDSGLTSSHGLVWRSEAEERVLCTCCGPEDSVTCPIAWGTGRGSAPPSIDTAGLWDGCLELTASTPVVCTPKTNAAVPLRKQASLVLRYWRMLNIQDDTIHSYHLCIPMACISPDWCGRACSLTLNLKDSSANHTRTWGFYFVIYKLRIRIKSSIYKCCSTTDYKNRFLNTVPLKVPKPERRPR